jgi:transcriptional regulator with XRE-family HTH domain
MSVELAIRELIDELLRLRRESGLTQDDIAEATGMKQQRVSYFEQRSQDPRLSTLLRYARAVDCTIVPRAMLDESRSEP